MDGGTVLAFVGFGEAAQAFAAAATQRSTVRAYDCKTDDPATRVSKQADYSRFGLTGARDAATALAGADGVLSLVTADQARAAAEADSPFLEAGAFWFDCNSVAPETKRAAARAIDAKGGRYVDVAILSPVYPLQNAVPLLVSGSHAAEAVVFLERVGFSNARAVPGQLGAASAIKMIRSVMVKGIEALTAECVLAAHAADVLDEVLTSLDASEKAKSWRERADYNLDRMLIHGRRRAAEMYEVAQTLDSLGISPMMSKSTVDWQQCMGDLEIASPEGLNAKLAAIAARREELGA